MITLCYYYLFLRINLSYWKQNMCNCTIRNCNFIIKISVALASRQKISTILLLYQKCQKRCTVPIFIKEIQDNVCSKTDFSLPSRCQLTWIEEGSMVISYSDNWCHSLFSKSIENIGRTKGVLSVGGKLY